MKVSVTARHFDLTDDLKEHAEGRLSRFSRFTENLLRANVVLEVQRHRHIAEVSVHARNGDFAGKAESDDMRISIDGACEKIERQILKNEKRLKSHKGEPKGGLVMGETRIESQRLSREMMTLDEATTRIEGGEDIVVFADTDTGATRVVYRRPDGSMKLIEIAE
jgi:putative sigma-54 modulation protein